jgi:hypothetical protein
MKYDDVTKGKKTVYLIANIKGIPIKSVTQTSKVILFLCRIPLTLRCRMVRCSLFRRL